MQFFFRIQGYLVLKTTVTENLYLRSLASYKAMQEHQLPTTSLINNILQVSILFTGNSPISLPNDHLTRFQDKYK